METVRDLVDKRVVDAVVGRDRELSLLRECLRPTGPVVCFVHGIPGIGKTALLEGFTARARADGLVVLPVDGRWVEPSERGFLDHLGSRLGTGRKTLDAVTHRLDGLEGTVVIAVDTYERLRLLDSWLRRTFVPALPRNAKLIVASRFPPPSRWFTRTGWQDLVRPVRLGPLSAESSADLLARHGVTGTRARRIQDFAHGHPLALRLAATAALEDDGPAVGDGGISRVVQELSRQVLVEVPDLATRDALMAASAVRRTTVSLLSAMLPDEDAGALHGRLESLPFVFSGPDGLVVHDTVREAIAAACRANDPDRYRHYRHAAWRQLFAELGDAGRSELWRYTADMLYLIENPICREAFFPSGAQKLSVEPADEGHGDAIIGITAEHEGPEAVDLMRYWWRVRSHRFKTIHDSADGVIGFYVMFPADEARAAPQDPIVQAWLGHLEEAGTDPGNTLFIRRWLSREDGESPSPVQAAAWLDIKRTYMEMRPDLRRVYLTVREMTPYARAAEKLGFVYESGLDRTLDGRVYRSASLDLGPASVDGWLAGLAAAEMGIRLDDGALLDHAARALQVDDRHVPLSTREYAVLALMERRMGEAVSRDELLTTVWQDADVASNVVDSVVYSLRRKMGEEGDRLETVRGIGYRLGSVIDNR